MSSLKLKLAPERRLAMTLALRQALEILQMPQEELGQWLREEIERNPLFKITSSDSRSRPLPDESALPSPICLYDHLISQVRERLSSPLDRMLAEELLEYLDERGFLIAPLPEIAAFFQKPLSEIESVLAILQSFDPPGICARSLQECFLLQLQNPTDPAYLLIRDSFTDLLHGRFSILKKKMGAKALSEAIQKISRLSMRPTDAFKQEPIRWATPDLKIFKIDGEWKVELIEDDLPELTLDCRYLSLIPDSIEEKASIRSFTASAKWLIRSLSKRRSLLKKIGEYLIRKQKGYLNQTAHLSPITLKEIAEDLQVHESTISRALSEKYAETPRGLIPLQSLLFSFSSTLPAKEVLQKMIEGEDKQNPLTDDQLAHKLQIQGIPLARRTISKYRRLLKIAPAAQRKNFR